LAGLRLLVVEDEYFIADDMAQTLRRQGAIVIGPAPSREAAFALLSAHERIDGAVLDINLRGETVFPVADALQVRGVPFVFATGYDDGLVPARYRDVPRWEKPFDYENLVRSLPGLAKSRDTRAAPGGDPK
jgi:CheY-like chemotaxis protein